MNILFLSRWFPYPPDNGSKLRIFNILKYLAISHDVTLISFAEKSDDTHASSLRLICQDITTIPWNPYNPNSKRALLGYFNFMPRSIFDTFSLEMEQLILKTISDKDIDIVIASQIELARYGYCYQNLPSVFEEAEVGVIYDRYAYANSAWRKFRYGLTWTKYRLYLTKIMGYFNFITTVSKLEKNLLSSALLCDARIEVIPNFIHLSDYKNFHKLAKSNTLIFTGSLTYDPNYEAMLWFIKHVYPIILSECPTVKLMITGDHANRPLPPTKNLTLTGLVDDIRPLISNSLVTLAPIWTGGGTRLKILEAMALGTAVVATSKGAEGLEVENGLHLLIADTLEGFAESVVRLLKEPELRRDLAAEAYQLVQTKYDCDVVMPRFLKLVDRTANLT